MGHMGKIPPRPPANCQADAPPPPPPPPPTPSHAEVPEEFQLACLLLAVTHVLAQLGCTRPVPAVNMVLLKALAEKQCLVGHPTVQYKEEKPAWQNKDKEEEEEKPIKTDSLLPSHSNPRSGASCRKGTWPGPGLLPCIPCIPSEHMLAG